MLLLLLFFWGRVLEVSEGGAGRMRWMDGWMGHVIRDATHTCHVVQVLPGALLVVFKGRAEEQEGQRLVQHVLPQDQGGQPALLPLLLLLLLLAGGSHGRLAVAVPMLLLLLVVVVGRLRDVLQGSHTVRGRDWCLWWAEGRDEETPSCCRRHGRGHGHGTHGWPPAGGS